jgi:hypothetical protein
MTKYYIGYSLNTDGTLWPDVIDMHTTPLYHIQNNTFGHIHIAGPFDSPAAVATALRNANQPVAKQVRRLLLKKAN